jgi:hypothetical protein
MDRRELTPQQCGGALILLRRHCVVARPSNEISIEGLLTEATLRAAQMANSSEKDNLEGVAKEWSALAEWVEQRHRYS